MRRKLSDLGLELSLDAGHLESLTVCAVGREDVVMGRPSSYPESFRRDAVELVLSSDRPVREVARELGVSYETLRSWVKTFRREQDPEQAARDAETRRGQGDAQAAGGTGEGERDSPQSGRLFCARDGSMIYRYRFISEHRAGYGVQRLCRVLKIRRQGFYEWLAARPGRDARAVRDEDLAVVITQVHQRHQGRYGRPRITTELRRRGLVVNHKRVGRVMSELGLAGITRRRRRTLTSPARVAAEPVTDLIGRDFTATRPGRCLVGDITCLVTGQGRLFLATVIDLHNREVIGHALGSHAHRCQ